MIVPSVCGYEIVDTKWRSAIVGYLIEIHGQGGPAPEFFGVFRSQASFYESLRRADIVLDEKLDTVSDRALLKYWGHG